MKRLHFCSGNFLFLIIIQFLLFGYLWAGTTGKIAGRVEDSSTGEALIGVNIYLDGYPYGAASDIDGFFYILNVPPGTYTLVAQMLNYRDARISDVKVNIDLTTRLDLKLRQQALDLGEEITVVAERPLVQKDVTSTSVTVSSEDIKAMPVETYDEVVNLQAGVVDGHFRGGRSGEVAYLVDGIPVNDQFNNESAIQVENASIQQLEVISGTFNAEYGQAMSGVVNIVVKEGSNKFESEFSGYIGNYATNHDQIYPNIGIGEGGRSENLQATISGPLPFYNKIKYFLTGRYFNETGDLYGRRVYLATDNIPFLPNGDGAYVSMNPYRKFSLQGKLSYYLTSAIKLSYTLFWDDDTAKYYDHAYRLTPDGIKTHYNSNVHHSGIINHTLSRSSFHTIKVALNGSNYDGYVYQDLYGIKVQENPDRYNPRYVNPEMGLPSSAYTFRSGGNQNDRYKRELTTVIGKYDFVTQITKEHKITLGAEYRSHNLYQFYNAFNTNPTAPADSIYDIIYPSAGSPGHEEYRRKPYEFHTYFQDKMEYEDFIVNIGLRYDFFEPNTDIPSDKKNPHYNPLYDTGEERAEIKQQLSPRLSVAFPISATGVIYGSYGHFFQVPTFDQLYRGIYDQPDGKTTFVIGSSSDYQTVVGNPNLKSESTTKYELGLQQMLYRDLVMYLTAYYSDIRNWVQVELVETYDTRKYARFINRDYANVMGFIVSLEKRFSGLWSANLDYTYQIAKGNASDPQDALTREQNNVEVEKTLIPLDWDQRSTLNFTLNLGRPANWMLGLIGRLGSGTPYTADRFYNPVDITFSNDRKKPATTTFDLRAEKYFKISKTRLSLFLLIYNLFDHLNETGVYSSSGRAGIDYNVKYAGDIVGLNTIEDYVRDPTMYSSPREIRLGMSISY